MATNQDDFTSELEQLESEAIEFNELSELIAGVNVSDSAYIWKVPAISQPERSLLVSGYIRIHITGYVPPDLVHLCSTYTSWDLYSLHEILSAENGKRFTGPILNVNGFKFYIEVYPNGTRPDFADQIASFFCLTHLVPTVQSIDLRFDFKLSEIDHKMLRHDLISPDKVHRFNAELYWKGIYGQTKDIQPLQCMSFLVDVHGMSVHFKDGTVKVMPPIDPLTNPIVECAPQFCLWDVTDSYDVEHVQHAPNVYGFVSPIFVVNRAVKWYITFYPNGSKIERAGFPNVYLHIASLPSMDFTVNIRYFC